MYKFKFSDNTNDRFVPFLSLFLVLMTFIVGFIVTSGLAIAYMYVAHGTIVDTQELCKDALECILVNGTNNLIVFFLFPFLYLVLIEGRSFSYLSSKAGSQLKLGQRFSLIVLGIICLIIAYPAILKLGDLTEEFVTSTAYIEFEKNVFGGTIKGFAAHMMETEKFQETLIKQMISVDGTFELILLFLAIAVIPGIAEEFIFRGIFQNILMKISYKPHLAIWVVAFLFSAMHFSLVGFLPRFLMGALLGYVYFYSQNIWIPIFIHATNNALSIINYRAIELGALTVDVEKEYEFSTMDLAISLLLAIGVMIAFRYLSKKTLGKFRVAGSIVQ